MHGDLRGRNVLIDDEGCARLTDFGMSNLCKGVAYDYESLRGVGDSIRWAAPELIDPEAFGFENYRPTPQSDVYSFACICMEVSSKLNVTCLYSMLKDLSDSH